MPSGAVSQEPLCIAKSAQERSLRVYAGESLLSGTRSPTLHSDGRRSVHPVFWKQSGPPQSDPAPGRLTLGQRAPHLFLALTSSRPSCWWWEMLSRSYIQREELHTAQVPTRLGTALNERCDRLGLFCPPPQSQHGRSPHSTAALSSHPCTWLSFLVGTPQEPLLGSESVFWGVSVPYIHSWAPFLG